MLNKRAYSNGGKVVTAVAPAVTTESKADSIDDSPVVDYVPVTNEASAKNEQIETNEMCG